MAARLQAYYTEGVELIGFVFWHVGTGNDWPNGDITPEGVELIDSSFEQIGADYAGRMGIAQRVPN